MFLAHSPVRRGGEDAVLSDERERGQDLLRRCPRCALCCRPDARWQEQSLLVEHLLRSTALDQPPQGFNRDWSPLSLRVDIGIGRPFLCAMCDDENAAIERSSRHNVRAVRPPENNILLWSFSCVCPEPVLVKRSFSVSNGAKDAFCAPGLRGIRLDL